MMSSPIARLLAVSVLLLSAACTTGEETPDATTASSSGATSGAPTEAEPTETPLDETPQPQAEQETEAPGTEPPATRQRPDRRPEPGPAPDPISVQALIETDYDGRGLRVGAVLDEVDAYTRYAVAYRSEGLRISGIMNVPTGRGPFPVLVLNHGYIEPDIYVSGQGLAREQNWLAREGYVVLHTDYRNHAGSDDDPDVDYEQRLPYTVDVINAVRAIKRSRLPYLDGDRVGLLGRSMGGNVTLNALVAQPGLVDAAVVYASTSSLAADNWRQFSRSDEDRSGVNARIEQTYGLPGQSPAFWRAASPRPHFDRVTEPVLMHHGTLDGTCPIEWSQATVDALQDAGKRARLVSYEGEGHAMYAQWQRSIELTTAFFDRELG